MYGQNVSQRDTPQAFRLPFDLVRFQKTGVLALVASPFQVSGITVLRDSVILFL